MSKLNKNSTLIVIGVLIGLIAVILFYLFNNKPVAEFVPTDNESGNIISLEDWEELHAGLFTVAGKYTCLPLKDETKPHNDLCVLGIKVADDYYRLEKISDDPLNVLNKIKEGQNIEVSGELTAPQSDDEYLSLGTIKVTGIRNLETAADEVKSDLPASFKANYISFSNYGTGIFKVEDYPGLSESRVLNGEIDCDETPLESSLPMRVIKREINGKKYCVAAASEGAAGSVVTTYAYNTVIADHVYLVQFVANYPNCPNYPDKERADCESERTNFNLDLLVDQEIEKMNKS